MFQENGKARRVWRCQRGNQHYVLNRKYFSSLSKWSFDYGTIAPSYKALSIKGQPSYHVILRCAKILILWSTCITVQSTILSLRVDNYSLLLFFIKICIIYIQVIHRHFFLYIRYLVCICIKVMLKCYREDISQTCFITQEQIYTVFAKCISHMRITIMNCFRRKKSLRFHFLYPHS